MLLLLLVAATVPAVVGSRENASTPSEPKPPVVKKDLLVIMVAYHGLLQSLSNAIGVLHTPDGSVCQNLIKFSNSAFALCAKSVESNKSLFFNGVHYYTEVYIGI